jgi:hypothetical protein
MRETHRRSHSCCRTFTIPWGNPREMNSVHQTYSTRRRVSVDCNLFSHSYDHRLFLRTINKRTRCRSAQVSRPRRISEPQVSRRGEPSRGAWIPSVGAKCGVGDPRTAGFRAKSAIDQFVCLWRIKKPRLVSNEPRLLVCHHLCILKIYLPNSGRRRPSCD